MGSEMCIRDRDTSYVAVEIGVFTDGFVEVKGNISEGQIVVVPR